MPIPYRQTHRLHGHTDSVVALAFTPDGSRLASAACDGRVIVWSTKEGKAIYEVAMQNVRFTCAAWLNNTLAIAGTEGGDLVIIEIGNNDSISASGHRLHTFPLEYFALCPRKVASGAKSEVCILTITGIETYTIHRWLPVPAVLDSDERPVVVTSLHWANKIAASALLVSYLNHGVVIWDTEALTTLRVISFKTLVGNTALSPDQNLLAVSNVSTGFDIYSISLDTRTRNLRSESHITARKNCLPVLFINNGRAILGGSSFGRPSVWHLDEKIPMQELIHHDGAVILSIADFGNDQKGYSIIATGTAGTSNETYIQLWQAKFPLRSAGNHNDRPSSCSLIWGVIWRLLLIILAIALPILLR